MNLTIEARDNGSPSLASRALVVVDILDYNDNDPVVSYVKRFCYLLPVNLEGFKSKKFNLKHYCR